MDIIFNHSVPSQRPIEALEQDSLDERWKQLWQIAEAEAAKASTPREKKP